MSISHYLKDIGRGSKGARSLTRAQACDLMGQVLDGQVSDLELGGFCIAMRFKGESAEELAGFVDAAQQRMPAWPVAADTGPLVVIPSYNGARKLPNLTPLLAGLLSQRGLPVLVHGCDTDISAAGRTSTEAVWQALGWSSCTTPAPQKPLAAGEKRWIRTRHWLPALERLLQLRRQMGVRNSAHSLVKLLDPVQGGAQAGSLAQSALLVSSYTHPAYAEPMQRTLALRGSSALLLRGSEGEAVAAPHREPPSLGMLAGQLCFERSAIHSSQLLPGIDEIPIELHLDALETAHLTTQMLSGQRAVPAPIASQVEQIVTLHRAMQNQPGSRAALQTFQRQPE